jgi:hypothetical protein
MAEWDINELEKQVNELSLEAPEVDLGSLLSSLDFDFKVESPEEGQSKLSSDEIPEKKESKGTFFIEIECEDREKQKELFEELSKRGLSCWLRNKSYE